MNFLVWSSLSQWVVIVAIIVAAFVLPEPKHREVMQGGGWSAEKSAVSATNRLIYARRFVRRGAGIGLLFGIAAAAITFVAGYVR